MKTITVQLIKNMGLPQKDVFKLRNSIHTLYEFASPDIYDYQKLGGNYIMMSLKTDILTTNLIPMLNKFYSDSYSNKYSKQQEDILKKFENCDQITWWLCEEVGYRNAETFYPCFVNDANPKPYLMSEQMINVNCTGIILRRIPPEEATFAMLYTLESDLQKSLSAFPLAKALKVCIR